MPGKFALVEDEPWKGKNVHKVQADNFMIFYQVVSEQRKVIIMRIFYKGQNYHQASLLNENASQYQAL